MALTTDVKLEIDEILHLIVSVGIKAASIFVKNPKSQQSAANIIGLVNDVVLPVADGLLNTAATTNTTTPTTN